MQRATTKCLICTLKRKKVQFTKTTCCTSKEANEELFPTLGRAGVKESLELADSALTKPWISLQHQTIE